MILRLSVSCLSRSHVPDLFSDSVRQNLDDESMNESHGLSLPTKLNSADESEITGGSRQSDCHIQTICDISRGFEKHRRGREREKEAFSAPPQATFSPPIQTLALGSTSQVPPKSRDPPKV